MGPLTDTKVSAQLAAYYRLPPVDETRFFGHLQVQAERNRFYGSELAPSLVDEGEPDWHGHGRVLGLFRQTPVSALRPKVIDGCLARLGDTARQPMAVATVIGRPLPLALWARVIGIFEKTLLPVT